jgi:periplasmic mercuric ion binding protein
MKTLNIYAAILFSIFAINFSTAQTTVKKETIKVWGNCGMCKTNIEKAAKKAGATKASWNEESKELKVSYTGNKTSAVKIQQAIAKSGYDTQGFTADDKVYNKLHGCCQYDRKNGMAAVETEKNTKAAYCCTMHPDVKSDLPGKCSKCGMDLTKSKKEQMKMEVMKTYTCPMHSDITSNSPEKCSKCGMDLKEKQ